MWPAAAALQIRSCCSFIEKIRSSQYDTWLTWLELRTSPLPDELISNPSSLWAFHLQRDVRQWSAMVAWCAMTWSEQNPIQYSKCTNSCLWKVFVRSREFSKLQTLYKISERTAGHSLKTQGVWPTSLQKDLETVHATKLLMFLHVRHRSRIRVPQQQKSGAW